MSVLEIRNLRADYQLKDGVVHALRGVDLTIDEGEFFVLLGPSGCGKTTMLRSIAGLEHPRTGEILIDGEPVFSAERRIFVPPDRRPIAMVFQSYAIWPHMNVFENIAFPLRSGRAPLADAEIGGRVGEVLDMLDLGDMADRPVTTLSGGQQQRVALARALALRPRVLLMDEPLSNLDFKLQVRLRSELRDLMHRLNLTTVHVTHNQGEALEAGDRIAVMDRGRAIQIADPVTIYHRPKTEFVARFIGEMNLFPGRVASIDGAVADIDTGLGVVQAQLPPGAGFAGGDSCVVGIRPEDLQLVPAAESSGNGARRGRVQGSQFVGEGFVHSIEIGGETLRIKTHRSVELAQGADAHVHLPLAYTIAVAPDPEAEAADDPA